MVTLPSWQQHINLHRIVLAAWRAVWQIRDTSGATVNDQWWLSACTVTS